MIAIQHFDHPFRQPAWQRIIRTRTAVFLLGLTCLGMALLAVAS